MRIATALLMTAAAILLGACSPGVSNAVPDECFWTEPIRFDPATKEWLGGLDWPPTAQADFSKIGDHNELRERFCN